MKTKQDYISREAAVNAISKAAAEKWAEHFWSPMPDQNSTFVFGVNVAVDAINSLQPATLTNGDMIRQMTDEELATWLNCMQSNAYHCGELGRTNAAYPWDNKSWLNWLEETIE